MTTSIIVVPCYNEAPRLNSSAFESFAKCYGGLHFLFVNDGSTDDTPRVLNRLAATDAAAFSILKLAQNCGKSEAVRQGVLAAAQRCPSYIGYWDADLATPLESIPEMIAALDRLPHISLVMGVRVPLLGHAIRRRFLRHVLGRAFCRAASLVLRAPLADTQCGAKLFRATSEMVATFGQPFRSRWIFDVEILARMTSIRGGLRSPLLDLVYEQPLDAWRDVAGSKLKKSDFVKAFGELTAIWWHYLSPFAERFTPESAIPALLETPQERTRRAA